jgi:alanyl-tRNA synthetase
MGEQYKEIVNNSKLITNVILQEEQSFLRTLSKGLKRIDEIISHAKKIYFRRNSL